MIEIIISNYCFLKKMEYTLNSLETEVKGGRTEIRKLVKVITESEEINNELVESHNVLMKKTKEELILTQIENEKLRKVLGEKQTALEMLDHQSQEQQRELQKYHGIEKKGKCEHYDICGGHGNIYLGAKTHRKSSRCPFSNNNEIHNL